MSSTPSVLDELSKQSPLTILQRIVRIFDQSIPRFNDVGSNTILKLADKADLNVPDNDIVELLETVSEKASDAISGLLGDDLRDNAIIKGAAFGLSVGIGTVLLHPHNDVYPAIQKEANKKKLMTVGLYVVGGILATLVVKQLEKKNGLASM